MMRRDRIAGISLVMSLCLAGVAQAQAQEWGKWVSTEHSEICYGGITGFNTKGHYGSHHKQRCDPTAIVDSEWGWKDHINDRQGQQEIICTEGLITRFACNGDYCSYVRVSCGYNKDGADNALYDHRWLPVKQTKEGPNSLVNFSENNDGVKTVLVGLRCSGSWCDTLEFYVAKVGTPAPVVKLSDVVVRGKWVQKCVSGGNCSMTTEKEYTFSSAFTNSYSQEVETRVEAQVSSSTTVEAGYEGGGASASASATLTASLTTGLTNAVNTARSSTDKSSTSLKTIFNCNPPIIPIGKLGYFWQSTVKIGPNTATVLHCLDACADAKTGVPTWAPGTNITSCNYTPEQDAARGTSTPESTNSAISNISYNFNYGDHRGVQAMRPGDVFDIYNEKGGCGPNDIAQCQVNANGTIQAKYRDSCGSPKTGAPVSNGCSKATFKNYTVTCCTP
ncbi:hypothetical protein [Roseivivax sp. CAU 1753]